MDNRDKLLVDNQDLEYQEVQGKEAKQIVHLENLDKEVELLVKEVMVEIILVQELVVSVDKVVKQDQKKILMLIQWLAQLV